MSFYDTLAATASTLIKSKGRTVKFSRRSHTLDPVLSSVSATVDTVDADVSAVVLPASKGTIEAFDNRLKEGLLKGYIRALLIAADTIDFEPEPNDIVTLDGARWTLLGCTPISPAGTPVVYKAAIMKDAPEVAQTEA